MCVCLIVFLCVCVSVSLGVYFPVSPCDVCLVSPPSVILPPELGPPGHPSRARLGQGHKATVPGGCLLFWPGLGAGSVSPQQCSVSLSSQCQIPGLGWQKVAQGSSVGPAPPPSLAQRSGRRASPSSPEWPQLCPPPAPPRLHPPQPTPPGSHPLGGFLPCHLPPDWSLMGSPSSARVSLGTGGHEEAGRQLRPAWGEDPRKQMSEYLWLKAVLVISLRKFLALS